MRPRRSCPVRKATAVCRKGPADAEVADTLSGAGGEVSALHGCVGEDGGEAPFEAPDLPAPKGLSASKCLLLRKACCFEKPAGAEIRAETEIRAGAPVRSEGGTVFSVIRYQRFALTSGVGIIRDGEREEVDAVEQFVVGPVLGLRA